MVSIEEFYSNPLNQFNPAYRPLFHFLRITAHYRTGSLEATEKPKLRRDMQERYKLFSDKYDHRILDRNYVKFALILEDIAKGRIKVKDKRHISKIFNELEQN